MSSLTSIIKAYITYVRPILEFNTPVWSPTLIMHIKSVEATQRSFTKRIPGISHKHYHERLLILNLDSLELRRLIIDLITLFKIVFGLLHVNLNITVNDFNNRTLRRHQYQLCSQNNRTKMSTFLQRTVPVWNCLPVNCNFTSIGAFKNYLLNNKHLLMRFLKVLFCLTFVFIMFRLKYFSMFQFLSCLYSLTHLHYVYCY